MMLKLNCFLACDDDEEYRNCGCTETCNNWKEPKSCTDKNCAPGCYCKNGLVRHVPSGKCIPRDICPKRRSLFSLIY